MRLTVRSLLGLLVLAVAPLAFATPETPQFRVVGVADGLPSSEVAAFALDRDGYLWIGTRDGLARYDGVGYRIYRHVPGDATSLPGNSVQALHVDARNRLWIGVESQGIAMLGPERGAFTHIAQDNRPILRSNDVWSIAGTPDGAVWFGTYAGGLYRLDTAGRMARFLPRAGDPRSLPSADVSALATLPDGSLWIGTFGGGVARWTGRDFERLPEGAIRDNTIFGLSGDPDGSLWIGMADGVARRFGDGRMDDAPWLDGLKGHRVQAIVTDLEGMRWFATATGLVTERGGRLRRLGDYPLALGPMTSGIEDRDGGLWFGSNGAGLRRLPPNWRNFSVFGKDEGVGRVAALPVVGHAPGRDGRVWLLGGSVVQRMDTATGTITTELDLAAELPGTRAWSLLEREDGGLWIGHSRGLSLYHPARASWRHWRVGDADDPALPGAVQSLVESHGLLWLLSYGGGVQARDAGGALVHNLPAGERGVDTPDQDQMGLGPDGRIWLAGPKGLRRWNTEEERFDAIPGAPDAHVYGFTLVPPDALWLHRMGRLEAYRWNGAALARFRSIGAKDGLPAAESGGMFADRGGALWLTTARGLVRYDPLGARLRVFGVRDGLPSQEFLMYPPLMLPQGLGLASTRAGLVLFDPARIRSGWTAPRLVLESVRFRRGDAAMQSPPGLRALTLAPEDRDLRVGARLLSFADPASHRYQFRLRGYERDWVDVGTSGEREFSQLPPGTYRLEARAGNADGLWSAPLAFEVQVLAPWWHRPWATAAWAMLGIALLAVIGRAYRARVRERAALLLREQQRLLSDQGSEAKTRFLATLGHEIRTPMTGVLGMAELLQRGPLAPRQRMQVEAIHRAGEHLLRLVNDALDLARIEAGKLVLDDVAFDLHLLVEDSAALLRPLAEAKSLEFALHRAPGTPRAVRGDAGRVRQILFNLGSNAIKFTEHGEVGLRVAGTPNGLLLEIADTGPGMSDAQQARLFQRFEQLDAGGELRRQGSGLGLAICRELVQAMGGRIDVQSQPGRGTTFRVLLPLPVVEGMALAPALRRRRVRAATGLDILVVEDDPTIADVVTGLLEALGHRTEHAAHGLGALTALAQSRFDLAFLDLDLPGLDGFNLARVIRGQGHGTALVALTARADAQAEPLALAAGMHGFLRKPVTSAMLQDAIDRTMVALRGNAVANACSEQAQH